MAATELAFNTTNELKRDWSSSKDDLRYDTSIHDGRKVTIARDAQGNVAYPSYVPPETQDLKGRLAKAEGSQLPPSPGQPPLHSRSDPLPDTQTQRKQGEHHPRPSMERRSASESVPEPGACRYSTLPVMLRRAGTNVSELQKALWTSSGEHDWSDSSSSSEDEAPNSDGELEKTQKDGKKAAKGWQTGKGKGKDKDKHEPPKARKRLSEDKYRRFFVGNENYQTKGKVSKRDGRLAISVNDTSSTGYLAKAIGSAVKKVVPRRSSEEGDEVDKAKKEQKDAAAAVAGAALDGTPCPRLSIVIMVIGSRGDVQPFLRIGQILKEQYGHRVRIATHPAFREFVEKDSGLEFFSVGGDPSELMSFMVRNPGLIPSLDSMRAGDIGRRRKGMAEMFEGMWRACIDTTDDQKDAQNLRLMGSKDPFVADAIIANPPSFAHYHIAEALGIPLHLCFTFPYTPTTQFPHPLANIKKSNVDPGYANFISYPLVEMMVWQGLGDLINDFRVKTLGLDPVSTLWAPGATYRLHVPFTYLWSPGLVPKPEDWGDEIDISGFVFLDLASSFTPPSGLEGFIDAGPEPLIYLGFGSIVVDDADRFTEMIFEAVKLAGVRALVSKGWGGLGHENVPDNIYMLENTPHDWLFPRVAACVIHGGAGTTAIALKCGKPTMVVPFFGDQHFWGSMLSRRGVGPDAVPYKHLTAENLAEGIKYCLTDEAKTKAQEVAKEIDKEGDGAANACRSFHKHLTLRGSRSMRCSIVEDQVAVWHVKHTSLRLSAVAADVVVGKGFVPWRKLRLIRHREWNDFEGPGEPVTGLAGSLMGSISNVLGGVGGVPYRLAKSSSKRKERKERRKRRQEARNKQKEARETKETAVSPPVVDGAASEPEKPYLKEKKDEKRVDSNIDAQDQARRKQFKDGSKSTSDDKGQQQQQQRQQQQQQRKGSDPNNDAMSTLTATTVGEEDTTRAGDFVTNVGKGVGKSAHALARAPVDLSVAVAQGFHNAPRLYGDDTVRRPHRVTGLRSGLRAARLEFGLGIYDGWTGVVRLPVRGARDGGGFRGFAKGVGMGLTGFVLKDFAAVAGLVAYPLKGVAKELEKGRTPVLRHIRRARIVQAQRELGGMDPSEREKLERRVVKGWGLLFELAREIEAAERQERKRKGMRGKIGLAPRRLRCKISVRRRRGLGEAFESVETARRALEAVRRGELEAVVEMGVRSRDEGKGKVERKAKMEQQKEASEMAGERRREDVVQEEASKQKKEKKKKNQEEQEQEQEQEQKQERKSKDITKRGAGREEEEGKGTSTDVRKPSSSSSGTATASSAGSSKGVEHDDDGIKDKTAACHTDEKWIKKGTWRSRLKRATTMTTPAQNGKGTEAATTKLSR